MLMRLASRASDASFRFCAVLDFVGGGDLFEHLKRAKRFDEDRARLYAAEIFVALSYMHSMDIVYRSVQQGIVRSKV